MNIPRATVWRTLNSSNYKSFKIHVSQTLHPGDNNRRLHFCNWLLDQTNEDINFARKIIWTDESNFSNLGFFNRKNEHIWSIENPKQNVQVRNQNRFGFNVWIGLLDDRLLGPLIYEGTLNSHRYLQFLRGPINEYLDLDNVPLIKLRDLWWQQDGAPPHNAVLVRNYLDEIFPNKWIGNRSAIEWPARSPDLSPLDYFLWGTIKNTVYKQRYENVDQLRDSVVATCQGIPRRNIQRAIQSVTKRARICVQENGFLFEHLIQ